MNHFKNESTVRRIFLDSYKPYESLKTINDLSIKNPNLKVYHFLPKIETIQEYYKPNLIYFGVALGLLIVFFTISLYYLYRKYQVAIIKQRKKDLDNMDALSVVRSQYEESRKKRDKTELNVSSFVTLNIQTEVLDLAYTKLGLRVNPQKLTEQLEKTKIPNISYKIYTISNSYGLNVKMQSVTQQELPKLKSNGAVVLVLKGDLIALLKNADSNNAYLQFSQKDSRKVPYNYLKLSWEGNIILLNTV